MSIRISTSKVNDVVIVQVSGRITLGDSGPALQNEVRKLLTSGKEKIILDLSGVTFIDSSGLGQLVGSYATAMSQGSEIRLLNLNKRVYDLMQITKLYTIFAIYNDRTVALNSFASPAIAVHG